jgi:ABC-type multidrug transport system fused ATPase/permease subunit
MKPENKILVTWRLFKRAFGVYRYKIILLITTGFLSGLMEGIGINTVIPLFSFIVKSQDKPTDVISTSIEAVFMFLHVPYTLKFLLGLIAILFILKAIMVFCTNYITDKIRTDYITETRAKLLDMTLEANWSYLSKQKIGHLEKVIMNDIQVYSSMLSYMSSTVILATNIFVYAVIAFNVSPGVTFLTLGLGALFFLAFKPIMDKVRKIGNETGWAQKQVANHINESMLGIKTIKAMALEQKVLAKGKEFFERLRSIEMRLSVIASFSYVITQPFSILIILGIFAYSYKLTTFSFASFAVIVYSINKIVSYVQDGQTRLQSISNLYPFLRSAIDFEEQAIRNKEPYQGKGSVEFKDKIEFKDVSFTYNKEGTVLSNINATIKKGTIVGIIGPSGSGKTTLVDLLLTLISPQQGDIYVDGKPLHEVNTKKWKQHIGYVSQDIFIVNDTLRNNIKYYDPSITDAEMITAAKTAYIYDFIEKQPHGFDTQAGERGMELSGGQRQRIALARVLARRADILVLDEATSALDHESETMIKKALDDLRGKITMVVIAHRPTTILNVDKLIVIENGKITEEGTPAELLAKGNSYLNKIHQPHAN